MFLERYNQKQHHKTSEFQPNNNNFTIFDTLTLKQSKWKLIL